MTGSSKDKPRASQLSLVVNFESERSGEVWWMLNYVVYAHSRPEIIRSWRADLLIFIFGSGLSLDLGNTPIAVINQAPGQVSYAIEQGFKGSPYLTPIRFGNIKEAESLMRKKGVKARAIRVGRPWYMIWKRARQRRTATVRTGSHAPASWTSE